ncbi:MAG: hypothetical protein ACRDVC_04275 [Acidimicrobiales bacterium]
MTTTDDDTVSVTRRIGARAHQVFALLTDPAKHPEFDGSGMLRDGSGNATIAALGDVFVMKMHNQTLGDYEISNHVVEFVPDQRIVWEPAISAVSQPEHVGRVGERMGHRWGYDLAADGTETVVTEFYDCSRAPEDLRNRLKNGQVWLDAMTTTLERLDEQCGGL